MYKIEKLLLVLTYVLVGELLTYKTIAVPLIVCWLVLRFAGLLFMAVCRLVFKLTARLYSAAVSLGKNWRAAS